MPSIASRTLFFAIAATPFLFAFGQQAGAQKEPNCEEVFGNIKVFKGVPASDLIPSMEFMSASLGFECTDCHDAKDYAADNRTKETARSMILMQREINAKHFNNRLEVTCMTCHGGKEHPVGAPIPPGVKLRHQRFEGAPKPETFFASHIAAAGKPTGALVRTGTLTAPNDATHKVETTPLEFIQGSGGKFRMVAGERKVGSDGMSTWYGPVPMTDEPGAMFSRIGRAWRGEDAFAGLNNPTVTGKDTIGKTDVVVVRGVRPATTSTEELSFDAKSGLLARLVNVRRSTLGSVIMSVDYSNYKTVGGAKVPMKVVVTFAGNQQWIMEFKSAKIDPKVGDDAFKLGG